MTLAYTALINLITSSTIGVFVLIKNPKEKRNRAFFYGCCAIAFFNLSYFFWQISDNEAGALFWVKFLITGFMIITVMFLHFVFILVDVYERKKKEIIVYYIINFIFIGLNFTSHLYTKMELRSGYGYWPIITPQFYLYFLFWLWECIYALRWLIKGFGSSSGIRREQIKLFTIAFIIAFTGGATNVLLYYKIAVQPFGNISLSILVVIVAYAIVRYQFFDIKVVFTNAGIFLLVYVLVLGIPLLIGFYTGYLLASYIALFIMASLGPVAYRFFQDKAENILLARQKRYQKFLNEASRVIVRKHDLSRLTKLIVYMVTRAVGIEFAVIFLEDRESGDYRLKSWRGNHPFSQNFTILYNSPFAQKIRKKGKPFIYSEEGSVLTNPVYRHVQLVVPCLVGDRLYGFLLLGEKRDRSLYTPDDIEAFELLSRETALAIENCYYIEENNKFQEKLFQWEKLSIIGGMAEGVAHQIKNRLNYFSMAASAIHMEVDNYNEKYRDLPETCPDLSKIFIELDKISRNLVENVRKTDEVIRNIIAYARIEEKENTFSEFSFSGVLDIASSLVQIKHDYSAPILNVRIDKPDIIYGIKSQIMESIYNILDNSYDAIEEKMMYRLNEDEKKVFIPSIVVRLKHKKDSSLIEICDNGVGIREENRKKIFAPYFTTKASFKAKPSSGVGMYVMYRIIEENHKGRIWFQSEYMKGTDFFIELPGKGA